MQRSTSFDATDYYPKEGEWSSTDLADKSESRSAPSSPINRNREEKNSEDTTKYVTVTLDIQGDSVYVVSVEPDTDGRLSLDGDADPLLKRQSVVNHGAYRPRRRRPDASKAMRGVNMFISMTDAGWMAVEKRFDKLTAKTYWLLPKSKFGECIGINSKEFALELFDTLARRRNITRKEIDKDNLRRFWCQITDQSFDSWLKIFFEMADKDGDDRLTENKVREFIRFTASANNKPMATKTANEYAAVIMKDFDTDDSGYIIMETLKALHLDMDTLSEHTEDKKKPKN